MGKADETTTHGGARLGAGRPTLPKEERRANVTIKLLPGASVELDQLAEKAQASQGAVVEWFVLATEAEEARKQCVAGAAKFTRRQEGQVESQASTVARAVVRRKVKSDVTKAGEKQQRAAVKARVTRSRTQPKSQAKASGQ